MDMSDYINLDPIEAVYIESYKFYCKIHNSKHAVSAQHKSGGFTKHGEYLEGIESLLEGVDSIDTLNPNRPDGEMVMICRKIQNLVNSGAVIIIYFNKIYVTDKDLLHRIKDFKI